MKQQENKAHNINLVSPTIYVYKIIEAIKLARSKGLEIPIIYNCNGYENVETIKKLDGIIDVYLPDFKYIDNKMAEKYSKVKNYADVAKSAIKEMKRQVGKPKFDKDGMIQKGLIVRHLVIPNHIENTKNFLKWFKENVADYAYISIMTQYFPTFRASEYQEINRKINENEYKEIEDYLFKLNIEKGYMQDYSEENEKQYVPKWEY